MIGQDKLQTTLVDLINNNQVPRFMLFTGPVGCGKKTLAHWVYNKFNEVELTVLIDNGVSIDAVRTAILEAHQIIGARVLILFTDADNMSLSAKNALLKLTEEPPNNVYVLMTVEDTNTLLETILSRARVFYMQPYSQKELYEYCDTMKYENQDILVSICETPGDMVTLLKTGGADEFLRYVQLVADNIGEVSLANSFKIASKVALKDGTDGYDLKLFFKAFQGVAYAKSGENWMEIVRITSKYISRLRIKGINKQMLFDNWILEVREILGVE